jgi:hypothetical protein
LFWRGVAKVKISGTSLYAELFDSRDNALAIRITGTIKDGRVDAAAAGVGAAKIGLHE